MKTPFHMPIIVLFLTLMMFIQVPELSPRMLAIIWFCICTMLWVSIIMIIIVPVRYFLGV